MNCRGNAEPLVTLLRDLVAIESVNPAYDPRSNEGVIAEYIEAYLSGIGVPFERQEVLPGRWNVLGRIEGSGKGNLLFEAHMDTASVEGMEVEPFDPRIDAGLLHGRGSCDTKGGLAAMLHALRLVSESGQPPLSTITLAATVDEEHSFMGVRALVEGGVTADGAVVAEPTELQLVTAHKGCLRWKVHTRGKVAHSSKPHLGVNAITAMAKVTVAIENKISPNLLKKRHPLLSCATLNIGLVRGGTQVNNVPDHCEIEIDRRLLPGEDRDSVWNEFDEVLAELRREDASLRVEMEDPMLEDQALETATYERIVSTASAAFEKVLGHCEFVGVPFGTDASKLSRAGIPSIVVGPGSIDQAHSTVEYVSLEQVRQAAELYRLMMVSF